MYSFYSFCFYLNGVPQIYGTVGTETEHLLWILEVKKLPFVNETDIFVFMSTSYVFITNQTKNQKPLCIL